MPQHRNIGIVFTLTLIVACGETAGSSSQVVLPIDAERRFTATVFDTAWVMGGPSDTLLAMPSMLRPYGDGGLVFYDYHNRKVYRVSAEGAMLWSWGQAGEGPGEIKNVRSLDVKDDGSIIIGDAGNQRILTISANGDVIDESQLSARTLHSVSALVDGKVAFHGKVPALGVWDPDQGVQSVVLPAGFANLSFVQYQGRTVSWSDERWVFGFAYGNGWAVLDGATVVGMYPYVEATEFPAVRQAREGLARVTRMVTRPPSSGRSLSVRGDTLFVLFGGTKYGGRVIDKYNLNTGRYVVTDRLPHYANRAVVGHSGRVFTVMTADLYPVITAITPKRGVDQ
ncbi:MAG: hypothetical protein OXE96_02590 [Gemmatimonadetes bacterium]|nr:hypothetical protein [Gemmatimonadota bacterium]